MSLQESASKPGRGERGEQTRKMGVCIGRCEPGKYSVAKLSSSYATAHLPGLLAKFSSSHADTHLPRLLSLSKRRLLQVDVYCAR